MVVAIPRTVAPSVAHTAHCHFVWVERRFSALVVPSTHRHGRPILPSLLLSSAFTTTIPPPPYSHRTKLNPFHISSIIPTRTCGKEWRLCRGVAPRRPCANGSSSLWPFISFTIVLRGNPIRPQRFGGSQKLKKANHHLHLLLLRHHQHYHL